ERPTQNGLPRCQPRLRFASAVFRSGRSSDSGAESRHLLQVPSARWVRKRTAPDPCQCRPTRSNAFGAWATTPLRAGRSLATRLGEATATAGAAKKAMNAAEKSFTRGRPASESGRGFPGAQGKAGHVDRVFTAVKGRLALFASLAVALALAASANASSRPRVLAIHFSLEINPVTQDYVNHQLDRAQKDHYDAAVILLDTPGGLSSSMESIYKKELASKIPVIVYIAPKGAAAASAGVFVSEAADVLAMAPDTNIGSSTPIDQSGGNLGSDLRRKVINHFAAKLRSLAENHGRNGDWADKAVRKASNLTEQEALRIHVIDVLAPDLPTLLRKIDGRVTIPNHYKLHTANAQITYASPTFFTRLLNTLIDPNLITLLFLAGLAGIGYEIFHPGVVLPGALGAVALVTALFGFSVLPISWAGLALLVLGIALLVIDAHVTSHGALTVSGLIAFVIGALML